MRLKAWVNIIASRLSYELGVHGEKKVQWKIWYIMKNGHISQYW